MGWDRGREGHRSRGKGEELGIGYSQIDQSHLDIKDEKIWFFPKGNMKYHTGELKKEPKM